MPALFVAAPSIVEGRLFGWLVERALPPLRGHVRIGGGTWSWRALLALARERPATFGLRDVAISDPQGRPVFRAERLSATLEWRGRESLLLVHELSVERVDWRLEAQAREPAGLVEALTPARGGTSRGGAFRVTIAHAALSHASVTFDFADWGLRLEDVHAAAGRLSYESNGTAPSKLSFEVADVDARHGGELRVSAGGRAWFLPLQGARIDRVAATSDVPDAVSLEAHEIRSGASEVEVSAVFRGVFDAAGAPAEAGLALEATAHRAGAVVSGLLAPKLGRGVEVGGDRAELSVAADGPYRDLRADVEARAFSLRARGLAFDDVAFHLEGALGAGRAHVDDLSAHWLGVGRVAAALRARDLWTSPDVQLASLTLTRPEGALGPRVFDVRDRARRTRAAATSVSLGAAAIELVDGVVRVRDLDLPVAGGRARASGSVSLLDRKTGRLRTDPVVDALVTARDVAVERAFGSTFVRGSLSGAARVHGRARDLTFDLTFPPNQTLSVFGAAFQVPRRRSFVLTEGAVYARVRLAGRGGAALDVRARADLTGKLALEIAVDDFPLARLPAVADTGLGLEGELSGRLRLTGRVDAPVWSGQLSIFPVALQGRSAGRGGLTISTEPSGLRARGLLMDGVNVDGVLAATPAGARGAIAVGLSRVRFDPPVDLPAGLVLSSVVSGVVVGQLEPGGATSLDGKLSDVTLSLRRAAAAERSDSSVELHAKVPIPVSLRSGGDVSVGPARFEGAAGALDLGLRTHGAETRISARGTVETTALAPLVAPWILRPSGAVSVALTTSRSAAGAPLAVEGDATVRRPLSFELAARPVSARIASGTVHVAGDRIDARDLPLEFTLGSRPASSISRVEGKVLLDARLALGASAPRLWARARVGALRLYAPLVGPAPVMADGGTFEVLGAPLDLDERAIAAIDLPLHGEARHVTTPAGVVDRATFAVRLRGGPERPVTVSGDVDVAQARVRLDRVEAARAALAATDAPPRPVSLDNPRLDLGVHARRGAIEVELAGLPNLHVDLDMHAGGTLERPTVTGDVRPDGSYTAILMALQRLLAR
ncbi:MAG TPA: hypothetical protein VHJ20_11090 [Polyangia bacterium]|nr:hypothetical protein [Polyangia bacterium]